MACRRCMEARQALARATRAALKGDWAGVEAEAPKLRDSVLAKLRELHDGRSNRGGAR